MSTSLPPAGWYPNPESANENRWWDGSTWTEHVAPRYAPADAAATPSVRGISWVVRLAIGLGVPVGLVVTIERLNRGQQQLGPLALFLTALGALVGLTGVASWLIWQYQVAKGLEGEIARSPGWHVGWWFIPFANWVLPAQNMGDLDRVLGRPVGAPIRAFWWATYLGSYFLSAGLGFAAGVVGAARAFRGYHAGDPTPHIVVPTGGGWTIGAWAVFAVHAAAATFAIVLVGKLTAAAEARRTAAGS